MHLDLSSKRICEFPSVPGQTSEEWFQWLHLEPQQRIELAVGEATKDPLTCFELHRHLPHRGGESRQHLLRITFADPPFGKGGEPENAVCETLRLNRNDAQARTSICEVVNHGRVDSQLVARSSPGRTSFGLGFGFDLRFLAILAIGRRLDQSSQPFAMHFELSSGHG